MYGCNNFCSYCIVPYVRGRERSRDFDAVLNEVKHVVAQGYKEITLLGQNVNSYNKDLSEDKRFPALLKAISEIEGDFIVRGIFLRNHRGKFKKIHILIGIIHRHSLSKVSAVMSAENFVAAGLPGFFILFPDAADIGIIIKAPGEFAETAFDQSFFLF